jgi:hypothetical protein
VGHRTSGPAGRSLPPGRRRHLLDHRTGAPPRQLTPGDLVLLPTGAQHELAAEPGLPLRRFDENLKRAALTPDGELCLDWPGTRSRILCAGYSYDTEVTHPVLGLLPPVLHVTGQVLSVL